MQGKIIKGIAGFYYIDTEKGVFECRAKGIFRNKNVKPLVGDNVVIDIINEDEKTGNLIEVLPRKNQLLRPPVVNVDQAVILFAIVKPDPNYNLLDRFLIMMKQQNLPVVICFNKEDIASEEEKKALLDAYEKCGYKVLFMSVKETAGVDEIKGILKGKTTVLAGPSGVGKSSLINLLYPEAEMETGTLSRKIQRGKNTTRHSELFHIKDLSDDKENTYIMDTPGFTSLYLKDVTTDNLMEYYSEFMEYEPNCRFGGCAHISEPDCGVKDALEKGLISNVRYQNYKLIYDELKGQRPVYKKSNKKGM
ncbi:MAG: ribosome small subunit-dependent GTPase A [Butyrivibrio sp.]|nr:ribosome small subunit-dependent GTPase A [Butyrivibrio sp.]